MHDMPEGGEFLNYAFYSTLEDWMDYIGYMI
jgi:hypothetical protein